MDGVEKAGSPSICLLRVRIQPTLWVTYGGDGRRKSSFDIFVDGQKIGDHAEPPRSPDQEDQLANVDYVIPSDLTAGKKKVTVRFVATNGNEIRGVFGIRTVRGEQPR